MNTHNKKPFLYFNFKNSQGDSNPLQFKNPIKIYSTKNMNEVIPCLKAVDKAINAGFYAAGYIAYEAAPAFNQNTPNNKVNQLPLLWFGIFNEPLMQEVEVSGDFNIEHWKPTVSVPTYYNHVNQIQKYIKNKQTEQVNYTIHLESKFTGEPLPFYKQLEKAQSANYSAYLDIDNFSILSASPELFFHMKNGSITTRPMKGTIGRGKTYAEDIKNAKWLKNSSKNQLENKLIVDLMKSELKEIAIPDTVNASNLYTIEKYPTLYQMTSTVTADIQPDIEFTDIFKALFPCGSITGLPKRETLDIISMLEINPREIYCGAIGWISPSKEAIFNVPIRTVLIDKENEHASYGVGGAITKGSIKEDEYEEVLTKAKLLTKKEQDFNLLESFGLIDGKYLVFQEHLNRLKDSATYFDFEYNLNEIKSKLNKLAAQHSIGHWKIRLILYKSGSFTVELERLKPLEKSFTSTLSEKPICKDSLFLYHKTTNRTIYNKHLEKHQELFDVLLWNEDYEITEFTMGNIVVEIDGKLYTPPVECGLLAGTFRESLLQKGIIKEKIIMMNELKSCPNIWFINSVRGWISVNLIP